MSAESHGHKVPPVHKLHVGGACAKALPPSTCSRPNAGAVPSGTLQPTPCPSSYGESQSSVLQPRPG